MNTRRGLSLVEFLLVLAILAIVGGVGFLGLRSLDTRSRVRQAAQVLVRQVDVARAEARRSNAQASIVFGSDPTQFTYIDPDNRSHTIGLPDATRFRLVGSAPAELDFYGPFGVLLPLTVSTSYIIESVRDSNVSASVAVVGVLGKAYAR